MSIEVRNETTTRIDEREFVDLARFVLESMRMHPLTELSILFVDESAMEQLHIQWMDEPGPTDVLSFPMDELTPGTDDQISPEGLLGDIAICPSVAAKQAASSGHSAVEEMLLLATHGMLHLMGYDHAEEGEKKVMFDLQRRLLLTFLSTRGQDPE